jgi:hypothetical protein
MFLALGQWRGQGWDGRFLISLTICLGCVAADRCLPWTISLLYFSKCSRSAPIMDSHTEDGEEAVPLSKYSNRAAEVKLIWQQKGLERGR